MYTLEDLQAAIAILTNVDLENPDIDQIDELIVNAANKVVMTDEILDAHEAGQITESDAHTAIAQIITDSAEADLDVFDLEIDLLQIEEEEEQQQEDYSAPIHQTVSFSQALGATISNLIANDYHNPSDGLNAIATATGLEQIEVERIIQGDAVPDLDTASNIAACFAATSTEPGYQEFMDLSNNARTEAVRPVAVNHKVNQIEAEFNAIKAKTELEDVLRTLSKEADQLVAIGCLTPHEKTLLFGQYDDEKEGLALFTAVCSANQTPVETQIDRIRHSLNMASQRAADARFSNFRHDDYIQEVDETESDNFVADYVTRNGII